MKFVKPKVYMLAATEACDDTITEYLEDLGATSFETDAPESSGELLVEIAGRRCYKSFGTNLNKNLTRTRTGNYDYIGNIINVGHGSVLEHSTVTIAVEDLSRVVTHEQVRHRQHAYSQESMRFVRPDDISFVMGESYAKYLPKDKLQEVSELHAEVLSYLEAAQHRLTHLCDMDNPELNFNIKKQFQSDNRRLLPEGIATGLVMTANHRAWRHCISLRTSIHAETEIRYIYNLIAKLLKDKFPAFYQDMYAENPETIYGDTCYVYKFKNEKI